MQNKIEFYLFNLLSGFVNLFPLRIARKLALPLAFIFYYFIPIRKAIAKKNLQLVFPDYTETRLKKILFQSYENLFIVLIEILYLKNIEKEKLQKLVKISDFELINEKLKENKGLIFLSAHFGNWEVLAASSALSVGRPYSIIVKPLRNPFVDEYMNKLRCKWGNRIVKLGTSVKEIFRELKMKKIVAIVADQRAAQESMRIKFFGRETSVFEGPAVLSVKTGAPILMGIAVRTEDGTYSVDLREIKVSDNLSEEEKIFHITKTYISNLEELIREYPEQWLWFHNRWRH